MKRIKYTLLFILIGVTLNAGEYKVSLEEAIDIALKNNQKLKISQTSIEIAETMYKQAMSAHYPTLDLSVSAARIEKPMTFSIAGTTPVDNTQAIVGYNALSAAAAADGDFATSATYANIAASTPAQSPLPINMEVQMTGRDTVTSEISTTIPLYTGGKISAIVQQAKIGKKIAQENKLRTKNEIIYDVKRYYYGVVLTKQLKKLSEETLEKMDLIRELTSRLYQGGSLSVKKTDYLRTKLSVERIKSVSEKISKNEIMAKSALLFAMGLSYNDTVEVTQESIKTPSINKNLEEIIENAYDFNHDYKTLKLVIGLHEAKIDEAQSSYLPSVGLKASAQNVYSDYEYGLVNDNNKNTWTIGIGLEWSLFDGMRTINEVKQSRLEKLKLKQQEIVLKDGIALQVKQAFIELNSTYNQYMIFKEAVQTAKESCDLNTRAYQEGMVDTKDVVEAQLSESLMMADYYESLYEHTLAHISVNHIVGEVIQNIKRDEGR